ncbi:MAG: hypothetical protein KBD64_03585 [Gammaproteobacteria bacterium]|nr:hypothetical protein [Gammaproteobacteria bacterium]
MTSKDSKDSRDYKPRMGRLKKLGVLFLIFVGLMYIGSEVSLYNIENQTKQVFIDVNQDLTSQNVSIDHVETSIYADGSNIYNLNVSNPARFSSPFAILANEIRINNSYSANPKAPYAIIDSVHFKKTYINYEINSNQTVNLYKILDSIINKLSPPNYQPLSILNSAKQSTVDLNYTGIKFFLGTVIFEKPTLYIYKNNVFAKAVNMDNIVINFDQVKQPLDYGDALLAGSLQLIDILDKTAKNTKL